MSHFRRRSASSQYIIIPVYIHKRPPQINSSKGLTVFKLLRPPQILPNSYKITVHSTSHSVAYFKSRARSRNWIYLSTTATLSLSLSLSTCSTITDSNCTNRIINRKSNSQLNNHFINLKPSGIIT